MKENFCCKECRFFRLDRYVRDKNPCIKKIALQTDEFQEKRKRSHRINFKVIDKQTGKR